MARFQTRRQRKRRQKAIISAAAVGGLLAVSVLITCFHGWQGIFRSVGLSSFGQQAEDAAFAVHILNVGKADAAIVQSGGQALLIDCGEADDGDTIATYLEKLGISHLTYAFGTHPDRDHIGGYPALLRRISANLYLQPPLTEQQQAGEAQLRITDSLQRSRIPLQETAAGAVYVMGDVTVQVLSPSAAAEEDNEASLVLRITYGDCRFLFMGDAGEQTERRLLNSGADVSADFLKVGHHGSKTATTAAFLQAVSPNIAAISVGWDSSDLPKDATLYRLYQQNCSVYRTDTDGTLLFLCDGRTIKAETEHSQGLG